MGNIHPLFRCHAFAVGRLFVDLLNTFRRMRPVLPRVDVFADVIPLQVTHAALLSITVIATQLTALLYNVCGIRTDALSGSRSGYFV